jgi:hypothetical protein
MEGGLRQINTFRKVPSQVNVIIVYFPPPHPSSKSGLKLVCNENIVYRNLKPESSQDYAQKS